MTDRLSLQSLSDLIQHQVDQARTIQNVIKRLNSAKRDSDVLSQRQSLLNGLQPYLGNLDALLQKARKVHDDLEKLQDDDSDNGSSGDNKDEKGDKNTTSSPRDQNRLPIPEDQENAYHLKARMMPHYFTKNQALEAELVLRNRRNELRAQRNHRQISYNRDTNLSVATTFHVINMYEKKSRTEEARANALQEELDELKAANNGESGQKTSDENSGQSLLGRGNRVNDVIRKNEHLITVVKDQNREIQRLKRDNTELVKKAKHAEQDKTHVMNQLSTSDKAKRELFHKFQKQKAQHDRLTRSLTRQSADWIEARKQQEQLEEEIRWRNVGHAAVHGSFGRTHSHPVHRNVDQPRYMYPVENYAQPVTS